MTGPTAGRGARAEGEGGSAPLLELRGVTVAYGDVPVVRDVDLEVRRGEVVGLVGESGSGKSTLARAALRHLPPGGALVRGRVLFEGGDVHGWSATRLRRWWRERVRLVPQDPLPSLNPAHRVGRQVAEGVAYGSGDPRRRALELFARVGLPDAERVARAYPHELSGGQQQRVMIAMALAGEPDLLILDEPTTNLDVTTEAAVLDLVRDAIRERGAAALFVSHDLAVVAGLCDRVAVMLDGDLVELAPTRELIRAPRHAYTRALLASVPRLERAVLREPRRPRENAAAEPREPLLVARDLEVRFPLRRGLGALLSRSGPRDLVAVAGVDLALESGRTLGLVGESGSGKSTLSRALVGLEPRTGGELRLDGETLEPDLADRPREALARVQMVFQSSDEALNPHLSVRQALVRPLRRLGGLDAAAAERRAAALLEAVRLPAGYLDRRPADLSGGERQRIAIARAFAADPDAVLFDESVSGLDVSVQAVVLDLLERLQDETGAAFLFISHDLSVVAHLADDVAVLYLGRLMQTGPLPGVLSPPYHPYTEALLSAVPRLEPSAPPAGGADGARSARGTVRRAGGGTRLEGDAPSPVDLPPGCPFSNRCPRFLGAICRDVPPPWREDPRGGGMLCHIPLDELEAAQTPLFDPAGPAGGGEAARV